MATFVKGELWDDGDGAAKILNTGFAEGQTIEVGRHDCLMRMRATITGTAPASVDLQIEYATPEAPTTFYVLDALPDDGALPGSDWVRDILLVPRFTYRFSAKRTGGDGTTALLLWGDLRDNTVVEGAAETKSTSAVSWIKSVLSSVFDSVAVALRVVNLAGPETVLYGETLFDETGKANGTYDYYIEHAKFKSFGLHYIPSGDGTKTLTIWTSYQSDEPDIELREYRDETQTLTGSPNHTDEAILKDSSGSAKDAKSLRIRIIVTGSTTGAGFKGFFRQRY